MDMPGRGLRGYLAGRRLLAERIYARPSSLL